MWEPSWTVHPPTFSIFLFCEWLPTCLMWEFSCILPTFLSQFSFTLWLLPPVWTQGSRSGVIVGLSDIMYIQVSRLFHLEHGYDIFPDTGSCRFCIKVIKFHLGPWFHGFVEAEVSVIFCLFVDLWPVLWLIISVHFNTSGTWKSSSLYLMFLKHSNLDSPQPNTWKQIPCERTKEKMFFYKTYTLCHVPMAINFKWTTQF